MRVTILYFAVTRDLVGTDREDVELPSEIDGLSTLRAWLASRHPALEGRLGNVRFAVDEELRPLEHPLHDGAVVALIPPVAGG